MKLKLLLIAWIMFSTLIQNFGQSYSVSGYIKDAGTGEALTGATVRIKDMNIGVSSNTEGYFTIENISQSKIILQISFMGYSQQEMEMDFLKEKNPQIKVKLKSNMHDLNQIEVVGQAEGQVKAYVRQKDAANIQNIISYEQIESFPDLNAAEVVQRIPGITIQRDQGEGKYVQLRGTSPEFTNFNINGEQISSPEGGARYVGLDIIAADQIEFIEVTKVITPDMDGDGIAGNVNIVTKSAKDTIPEISASLAGGYNNLMKTNNYQMQFSYGERFKKFGFFMNASYYKNEQGSHNMEYNYTRGPLYGQAGSSDTVNENFHILYKNIELRHYTITRQRIGLSANFDYKPSEKHVFYLKGMYNNFSDDEIRRRILYQFSDANSLTEYREADIEHDIRDRLKIQEISTINMGASHDFKLFAVDYEGAYSEATDERPQQMEAAFENGGITMRIDRSNPNWPKVTYPYEIDSIDAFTYENYEFDDMQFTDSYVKDKNLTAKMNIQIPYKFSKTHKGFVKFGAKHRKKEKSRDRKTQVFSKYFESLPMIYSQEGPELNLTTISDNFSETNLLNHHYTINNMIGADNMRSFYEIRPQLFKFDEPETWEETFGEDYKANEEINAFYFMFQHHINKLMILGGARYENTTLYNMGIHAGIIYEGNGILFQDSIFKRRNVNFILPQIQLKYNIDEKTNIRAAGTYSYTRPNFDDIIPSKQDDGEEIEIGNPDLKFPLSLNIDLLVERYLQGNGIISGGFFYKRIENIAFKYVRYAHDDSNMARSKFPKITMPVNGKYADVLGAEIQFQSKFLFFNSFLKDFGIYSNYTFTESKAYISKRTQQKDTDVFFFFNKDNADFFNTGETETIALPGQAKHSFNFGLFYDGKKLYAKITSNYHSSFLYEIGNDKGLDVYYDQGFHLDFNTNYQITKHLNCFVDMFNLTNQPMQSYMGSSEYFKQKEYYSWWGRLGVEVKL